MLPVTRERQYKTGKRPVIPYPIFHHPALYDLEVAQQKDNKAG
jgi:hypothetical protein